jgi:hypothetical protein
MDVRSIGKPLSSGRPLPYAPRAWSWHSKSLRFPPVALLTRPLITSIRSCLTCRRWNWRQGVRTRLTEVSVNALFLLESLAPMTIGELEATGTELAESLEKLSPGARITVRTPE